MSAEDFGASGAILATVVGLVFGSFANVCIHRIPEEVSIVAPRSRCPRCGALIRWYDNVPLVSWILLGARCRACRAPIPWTYPAVEAAVAAGFLGAYLMFGLSLDAAAACWLVFSCVVLAVIDARHFLLPDAITLSGLAAALVFAAARGASAAWATPEGGRWEAGLGGALDAPPGPLAAVCGAAAGAVIPLLARAGYRLSRRLRGRAPADAQSAGDAAGTAGPDAADTGSGLSGGEGSPEAETARAQPVDAERDDLAAVALEEGMGLGDVKMLAMAGAFLGARLALVTVLLGSLLGCAIAIPWLLLTRRGFRTPVPFGPFLAGGAVLALFAGDALAGAYGDLIQRLFG